MSRVLTMPAGKSAAYVHEHKVYAIQQSRQLLEQLGNGGAEYFAVREADGGRMSVLYRLQFGQGLLLDPNKTMAPQLAMLRVNLAGSAQLRLVRCMEAIKKLGPEYARPQLFYLLEEVQKLPRKPKPPRNGQWPLYFDLGELTD